MIRQYVPRRFRGSTLPIEPEFRFGRLGRFLQSGLPPRLEVRPGALKRKFIDPTTSFSLTDAATIAIDASKAGNLEVPGNFLVTTTASRTLGTPTWSLGPVPYKRFFIWHTASGGAWTLTLTTGAGAFLFGTDITTLTATSSGKTDLIGVMYHPGIGKFLVISYVKGFA